MEFGPEALVGTMKGYSERLQPSPESLPDYHLAPVTCDNAGSAGRETHGFSQLRFSTIRALGVVFANRTLGGLH